MDIDIEFIVLSACEVRLRSFLQAKGNSGAQIHRRLCAVYGNIVIGYGPI